MRSRNKLIRLFVILLSAVMLLSACAASASSGRQDNQPNAKEYALAMEAAQELAGYLDEHGELPDNFIRKKEAEARGWKTKYRFVGDLGYGIAIGGDHFGNYEGILPEIEGREYHEADCYYRGRQRNGYRLIYSSDWHYWFSADHYKTFIEIYPMKVSEE